MFKKLLKSFHARENTALEQMNDMVDELHDAGIKFREGITISLILERENKKAWLFIGRKYEGVLWLMSGVDVKDNTPIPYSDDIILYSYNDYRYPNGLVGLLKLAQAMTKGTMVLTDIEQKQDSLGNPTEISFVLNDKKRTWSLRTDTGSWELWDFFEMVNSLMSPYVGSRKLWYMDIKTHCYYVCVTDSQAEALNAMSGIKFVKVNEID